MSVKVMIDEAVNKSKLIYVGEKGDRSVFEVNFYYSNPNGHERVFIVSNEVDFENIIEEFCVQCDELFAWSYKEICKEE